MLGGPQGAAAVAQVLGAAREEAGFLRARQARPARPARGGKPHGAWGGRAAVGW